MIQQQQQFRRAQTAPGVERDLCITPPATVLPMAGVSRAALFAANNRPAFPPLPAVAILAGAPVVALATKSASNAKRSLAGAKPSAGGQS